MSEQPLQLGTAGLFGLHKQADFDTIYTTNDFYWFPFTGCDFSPVQRQGALPMESGAKSLPRGVFKAGVHAAGGLDFIPRLENRFGWILEAVCGDASFYDDQTIAQVIAEAGATAGVDTHLFGFQDADEFAIPYLTTRRLLPHDTAASQVGEIIQDVRIGAFTLNVMGQQIVTARIDMLGRMKPTVPLDLNPNWPDPTYDADDTFMVTSCAGSVKLSITDGTPSTLTAFDVRTASLIWTNNLLPPQAGARIGSPHPRDFPVLSRGIGINVIVYVADYDLYMQTLGGPANPVADTGWSCTPLKGDIDVTLLSPAEIASTGEYYTLRYRTDQANINWMTRPIVLVPNQPVLVQMTGMVAPVSSGRPFYIYLQNATNAEYA